MEISADPNVHNEKFELIWYHFQNGYRPPIYNPEQAGGYQNRKISLALSIPIQDGRIIDRIAEVTHEIGEIPGLYLMPTDYYHITVKWIGFIRNEKEMEYDIEPHLIDPIVGQIERIISKIPKFRITLKRINNLASFIVLEVEDGGMIAQIQGRLHKGSAYIPKFPLECKRWLPHLSIAGVKSHEHLDSLKLKLRSVRDVEIGTFEVTHIELLQAILKAPSPECSQLRLFELA